MISARMQDMSKVALTFIQGATYAEDAFCIPSLKGLGARLGLGLCKRPDFIFIDLCAMNNLGKELEFACVMTSYS